MNKILTLPQEIMEVQQGVCQALIEYFENEKAMYETIAEDLKTINL